MNQSMAIEQEKSRKLTGVFLTDSMEVGKAVFYALSFRHDPKTEVFFADSSYRFFPFEIIYMFSMEKIVPHFFPE